MSTTTAWLGECYICKRQRQVQTRYSHGAKVLCDECAGRPHRPPRATADDFRDKPTPDWISRTLSRLEELGLPVEGLGIPGHALSACPLCKAPMGVTFGPQRVDLSCAGGCPEVDIAESIRGGRSVR